MLLEDTGARYFAVESNWKRSGVMLGHRGGCHCSTTDPSYHACQDPFPPLPTIRVAWQCSFVLRSQDFIVESTACLNQNQTFGKWQTFISSSRHLLHSDSHDQKRFVTKVKHDIVLQHNCATVTGGPLFICVLMYPLWHWFVQGIMPRVYETFVVLILLTILVCGLAWVASALLDNDQASRQYLFGQYPSFKEEHFLKNALFWFHSHYHCAKCSRHSIICRIHCGRQNNKTQY